MATSPRRNDIPGLDWLRAVAGATTRNPVVEPLRGIARGIGLPVDAMDAVAAGPDRLFAEVISAATSGLIDREVELHFGATHVNFVMRALRSAPGSIPALFGQYDTVEFDLDDVRWPGQHLDSLQLRCRNVHLRPGVSPVLVVAPLEVTAHLREPTVREFVRASRPNLDIRLGDGTASVTLSGRDHWGNIEIEPRLEGDFIRLIPRALERGSRRLGAPKRVFPRIGVATPELGGDLRITGITLGDHAVVVDALLPQWREPVTPAQVEQIVRAMRKRRGPKVVLPRAEVAR